MKITPVREKYDGFLPAAACSRELSERLEQVAAENKVSKGEVLRQAVEFFLNSRHRKSVIQAPENADQPEATLA